MGFRPRNASWDEDDSSDIASSAVYPLQILRHLGKRGPHHANPPAHAATRPPPLTADRLRHQRTATPAAPCTPVRSRKHNTTKQTQRTCHESHASARTAQKRPMLTAARIRPPDGRPRNPTRGKTSGPRQPGVARRPSVWPQNPTPTPAPPPRAHLTRIEKSPPS